MFDEISNALDRMMVALQIFVYFLIGTIMTFFVGLPLAIGGRPEALIPLLLGGLALRKLYIDVKRIFRL